MEAAEFCRTHGAELRHAERQRLPLHQHQSVSGRARHPLGTGILMPRVLVIANPAAARTRRDAVSEIMRTLRGAGWRAEVLATGGPGDARRLAEYGVAERVDIVAVFGGDGTTMQAAAALVGTDVALGVI